MRAKTRKKISRCAAHRIFSSWCKKVTLQWGEVRFCEARAFLKKKPAGYSFHVLVMQAHVRTGPETMPNVEIMWAKVRYFLSQVSLYDAMAALRV